MDEKVEWHWGFLNKARILIGLLVAIFSAIGFIIGFFTQSKLTDARVTVLENTVRALSSGGNPMLEVCAELARQAAKGTYVERSYLLDQMEKMGCKIQK